MPELPDLEIIVRRLAPRLTGVAITDARAHRPTVLRNLLGGEIAATPGRPVLRPSSRRGKFLLLPLTDGPTLVINPMLAGRLR